MKKLHYFVAAMSAAGLLSLATIAHSADEKDGDHRTHHHGSSSASDTKDGDHGRRGGHPPFAKILDLTDEQKKTLEAARATQEPAQRALHEKLRAAHEALDKAGDANASDSELNKLAADSASLIVQDELARVKMRQQLLSVLTPEQKQKLASFDADHAKNRRETN